MKSQYLLVALMLVVASAAAEEVSHNGRTLDVAADQPGRPFRSMAGTNYAISLTRDEVFSKAQACLASQPGAKLESQSSENGQLQATLLLDFRSKLSASKIRSRMTFQAAEGSFQMMETEIGLVADGSTSLIPLGQQDNGWEKAIDALIQGENKLADCLYR